jgi:hypothetical protein
MGRHVFRNGGDALNLRPDEVFGVPYRLRGRLFIPMNVQDTSPIQISHGMQNVPIGINIAMSSEFNQVKVLDAGRETATIQFETAPCVLRLEVF